MTGRAPPLTGVRVLDLTRLLPGPMCTLYLADLGADVVKIEDTGAGDYARTLSPMPSAQPADPSRMTAWYRAINRNKRSLAIDLKAPAGHAAFMALARDADVVVEDGAWRIKHLVLSRLRVDPLEGGLPGVHPDASS